MKQIINKFFLLLLSISVASTSCKKDFPILNGATTEQTFNNPRAVTAVVIGLQRTYSRSVHLSMINANSLVTNEAILLNVGNVSEAQLVGGGGAVENSNALLTNFWTTANKIIYDANNAINAATNNKFAASQSLGGSGYASGVLAYATIFKALALGNLAQFWENVPDTVGLPLNGTATTTFSPRVNGFTRAVNAINVALAAVAANPISASFEADLPAGMQRSLPTDPPGANVINALQALKARFSLFAGNFGDAISAASAVDATKAVWFNFDASNGANPVFASMTSTNNLTQPTDSTLGLPVGLRPSLSPMDARVGFYTTINATIAPRFRFNGYWNSAIRQIPVYIVDEMRLIRAEALLRQSAANAPAAQALIDAVLKQAGTADPTGIGANIAAGYTGASDAASLLDEVYRNRCIELFYTGMKLEDMRRFGRPQSEMKRRFFPYPLNERVNNPNTPADPAF
jgi:starch-binding outer membrane protein, SusD/RagB family